YSPSSAVRVIISTDNTEAIMFNIGPAEWAVLIVVLLLVFGASRLPEIAKSIGKAIQEFKKGMKDDDSQQSKKE
ncbi:MAG: twin-arginine translocase TatA/TatE family subunit, partial [Candidatus Omnitrophica bacterium]|nr:twin-arginine translocase TatA/TatE family subunit [Candidatus Omnitrophota bacterium]